MGWYFFYLIDLGVSEMIGTFASFEDNMIPSFKSSRE
jgi:hypothetical protein